MNPLAYLDRGAVTVVARVAPWLAPLPTAWLVYDRTQRHLHWPWWVALVAGIALECLGIAILATALELHTYNRDKRKSDPHAPTWLPWILIAAYLLTAELLTVALDVWPAVAPFAPAVFPLLSGVAMAVLALRSDHQRRLSDIEREKADARALRSQRRAQRAAAEPAPLPFPCDHPGCDAAFASRNALNAHQRAHRNGRPVPLPSGEGPQGEGRTQPIMEVNRA